MNKPYSILGIIKRNFICMDDTSFLLLYKSMVCPHLEYANSVWWPYENREITEINKSSAVAEMGDRLATVGMGRKWEGAAVGGWVPTGSPSIIQCGLGQGLPLYQVASWSIQPFGHDCSNATLLHVGIHLQTIFIASLVLKTFTGCMHWVIARYQWNSSK